jgi:3',5'-cyclic AMP phosphodiesterase CpdA
MKFAIINDMHISAAGTGYENGVQRKLVGEADRLVRQFVDDMNTKVHPKFVVNLGDTIEDVGDKEGDLHYFKHALSLLSKLEMPVYHLIGNHDVKTNTREEIAALLSYDKTYYFKLRARHGIRQPYLRPNLGSARANRMAKK